MSNITVLADGSISGRVYIDTNQTARAAAAADADIATLVPAARVNGRAATNGMVNGDMSTAHAEVGGIQQTYDAGVSQGANMTINVRGQTVCIFCRGDIPAAAEAAGLNSLTLFEAATGKTFVWQPGMTNLRVKF